MLGFFAYLVAISPWFTERPDLHHQPIELLVGVAALIALLVALQRTRISKVMDCIRDWIPLGLTLAAFRSMELFIPAHFTHHFERIWVGWDSVLLGSWGLRHAIESLGWLIPGYLELCYLLVYGVGAYCLLILYFANHRRGIDAFYAVYLAGTLGAYALFPYFPSQPPRILFPQIDPPRSTPSCASGISGFCGTGLFTQASSRARMSPAPSPQPGPCSLLCRAENGMGGAY